MRILIACDGSESSDVAIDDLCRAGLPNTAEALVVSVAEVWLPPVDEQNTTADTEPVPTPKVVQQMWARSQLIVQHAKELADTASKRVRHNFPKWKVDSQAVSGSPAWEILQLDDQWKPDLIVVGAQGHSRLSKLVLGSVSQKILTEAKASVRIGRGQTLVGTPPQRVLIGVDGSASSLTAVKQVAQRSWIEGAEVRVAAVYDEITATIIGSVIPVVTDEVEELNSAQYQWAAQIVETAVGKLSEAGLKATPVVEAGDPKHVLVDYAEGWDADCIFTGSTGVSSNVERLLLGSVSAAVAARAKCSVEVVRER